MTRKERKNLSYLLEELRDEIDEDVFYLSSDYVLLKELVKCVIEMVRKQ